MLIRLVRHGQSEANTRQVDPKDTGDHRVALTPLGVSQAEDVGKAIGAEWLSNALVYCSPYRRTRETLHAICHGAGLPEGSQSNEIRVFEDPRLREVEHGYVDYDAQTEKRKIHGWFYYRFDGGESPADCYDRTSAFLESMMRQAERKSKKAILIVTHGLTLRCFLMRFMHLSVEQFEELDSPRNCDMIEIGHKELIQNPTHFSGRWATSGIRIREDWGRV